MKLKTFITSFAACAISVLLFSNTVSAAPQQMADGNIFDPVFYASTYPDVAAVYGTDANLLYAHYVFCGQAEGRLPYAQGATVAAVPATNIYQTQLDVFSALVGHGEVFENGRIVAQTSNYTKIETPDFWWTISGGRANVYKDESILFDAASYAALNPDVAAVYGTSKEALWNQYKSQGVYEGRLALGTTLNANAKLTVIQVAYAITTPSMTAEQKIRAVHDWMINYASYDLTYMDASQTLEGFIYNRTAVCAGYAKTFDYFMTVLGIPCEVVENDDHAWNRVALNGQWYYIDVTWDDPISRVNGVRREVLTHDYFLLTEAQMARDHVATESHDYY